MDERLSHNLDHMDETREMPTKHLQQFIDISNLIRGKWHESKNKYNNKYGIFFQEIYGELQHNQLKDLITHYSYGLWPDSYIWNQRVKKILQVINKGIKDYKKTIQHINLYYNAWKNGIHPDKVAIKDKKLKLHKDYKYNSTIQASLGDLLHKSKSWSAKIIQINNTSEEIKEVMIDQQINQNENIITNKDNNTESYIQSHIEFPEAEVKINSDKTWKNNQSDTNNDRHEDIQLELFPKEEQPNYGTQRVIVDWPLWYDRRKKSPEDPDMVFDYDI